MMRFKKLPDDIHRKIGHLSEVLKDEPDIAFMYLFGRLLNKKSNPLKRYGFAVHLKNVKHFDYLGTFSRISDILGTDEIDLVVLNNAPSTFYYDIHPA
jgi:uncharacterized protein